jgi:hypothetical protein
MLAAIARAENNKTIFFCDFFVIKYEEGLVTPEVETHITFTVKAS